MDELEGVRETLSQKIERRRREKEDRQYDIQIEREVAADGAVVDVVRSALRPEFEQGGVENLHDGFVLDQAEYEQRMVVVAERKEELMHHEDTIASVLSNTHTGLARIPEEAIGSLGALRKTVDDAANGGSRELFSALPEELQSLVERADRILEMHHVMTGSTHETQMERVYTPQAAARYLDDFCGALEAGLGDAVNRSLAERDIERTYRFDIGRPERPSSINAIPNLVAATLNRVLDEYADFDKQEKQGVISETIDNALNHTAKVFTRHA